MGIWKKLKAVLGIGSIWAVPAAVVGAIGGAVASVLGAGPTLGTIAAGAATMGSLFFALGSGFAAVFALAERNRSLGQLSPLRAALSGAIGGGGVMGAYLLWILTTIPVVADPSFASALMAAVAIYSGLGGALGAATVGIAKRADDAIEAGTRTEALPSSKALGA